MLGFGLACLYSGLVCTAATALSLYIQLPCRAWKALFPCSPPPPWTLMPFCFPFPQWFLSHGRRWCRMCPLQDSVVLYSLLPCHWCISVSITICYNLKCLSPYLSSASFKFKNKWGKRSVLFTVPWVCYCVRNMVCWKMLASWGTCSGFRINNWHRSGLGLCMYWYHCYNFKTDLYVLMNKGMNPCRPEYIVYVWMCVRMYMQARVHECICVCVSTCAVHECIAHV